MNFPALPELESNPQWDDFMVLDPGFNLLQEEAFSDQTEDMEDMEDILETEDGTQQLVSEAAGEDLILKNEPSFRSFGAGMTQYCEQSEMPYKEQLPANTTNSPSILPSKLGRIVYFIAGAARIAEQTASIHNILVSHEVSRFNQAIDTQARFAEVVHVPADQTRYLFEGQVSTRVDNLRKVWIEPRVGEFSQADREHVEKLPRFEQRVLAIMNIGLIKQESVELLLLDAWKDTDPDLMQDFYGSCLLEARKWQLHLLRDWVAELDGKAIKISDCMAEAFIKARVTGQ